MREIAQRWRSVSPVFDNHSRGGTARAFMCPSSSATGYNTSRNELLAIPLPCSRFSTEPCRKSMDGVSQMCKLSSLRRMYISALLMAFSLPNVSVQLAEAQNTPAQIHALKVTLLSTMLVGNTTGLGEWGFSALIEADGHRVLLDTGAHP